MKQTSLTIRVVTQPNGNRLILGPKKRKFMVNLKPR